MSPRHARTANPELDGNPLMSENTPTQADGPAADGTDQEGTASHERAGPPL